MKSPTSYRCVSNMTFRIICVNLVLKFTWTYHEFRVIHEQVTLSSEPWGWFIPASDIDLQSSIVAYLKFFFSSFPSLYMTSWQPPSHRDISDETTVNESAKGPDASLKSSWKDLFCFYFYWCQIMLFLLFVLVLLKSWNCPVSLNIPGLAADRSEVYKFSTRRCN